jgi:hypothetical protein
MTPTLYTNLARNAEVQTLSQDFLQNLCQKLSDDVHDDIRLTRKEFNALMRLILQHLQFKMQGGMYPYDSKMTYDYGAIILHGGSLFQCIRPNGPDSENGVHSPEDENSWTSVAKGILQLQDDEVIGVMKNQIAALQENVSSLNTFSDAVRDYAPRSRIVEAYDNIKTLQNLVESLSKHLEESDDLIKLNEDDINALRNLTNGNDSRIKLLETANDEGIRRDALLDEKIANLQNDDSDHGNRIGSLEVLTASHSETLDGHETRITDIEDLSKTFQDKSNHENDITLLTNRLNQANDKIQELEKSLAQLRADMLQGDINTRKKLYDELVNFGEQGEYLNVVWNDELQQNGISSKPLIYKMNMSYTDDQLALLKLHPVSMSTVFSEWQRFAHAGRANTEANQIENTKKAWSYDKSTGEISSNINSSVFGGFVSPTKHRQYYLKVKLRGNDTDNDIIGIVCAFYTDDNGVEHTLSVIRAKMIESHTLYRYGLVYDYGKTTEKIIAERNDVIKDVTGGWSGNYVIIDALRTGSRLIVKTSNINSDVLLPASEIDFTLPETKPQDWTDEMYSTINTMLQNPMQVGFGVFSENGRFTVLDQKYIFEDNDIYDILNDQILRYVEKTSSWSVIGKVTDKLEDNILVWSPNINTLFLYSHGGVQVVSTSSEWANGKDLPMSSINNSLTALQNKNTEQDNNIFALQEKHKDPTIQNVEGNIRLQPQDAVLNCEGDVDIMIEPAPDFSEFKIFINSNNHNVILNGRSPVSGVLKVEGFSVSSNVFFDIKQY